VAGGSHRGGRGDGGVGVTPVVVRAPHREIETHLHANGHKVVVGIDEVGRGAWAGPLMVGAAVVPEIDPGGSEFAGVRDSKLISETRREQMFADLAAWCSAWSVGAATAEECDRLGMAAAQRLATARALDGLGLCVDAAISDGKWDFISPLVPHVEMRVKADQVSVSVATASILAKVTRDRWMRELAVDLPHWAFETNKGYPCLRHRAGLAGYGPSAAHRRTWVFMDTQPWPGVRRVDRSAQTTLW
jgi:ribonuclease HII